MMERAVLALCIAFLAASASADLSLGSITDVRYLTLEKEDIGEFKASFFNMGTSDIDIELQLDYPSELRAEIYPKKMTIHPGATDVSACQDCEFFILGDGKSYVRTHPVYVYVKIPQEISRNLYEIKLTAIARNTQDTGDSGIKQSLAQVREIVFTARVRGSVNDDLVPDDDEDEDNKKSNTSTDKWWETELKVRNVSDYTSPSGGGSSGSTESKTTTTQGSTVKPTTPAGGGGSGGSQIIETDSEGNTKINLPVGNVILSKEETATTVDIGIITLAISVVSLLVKIIRS